MSLSIPASTHHYRYTTKSHQIAPFFNFVQLQLTNRLLLLSLRPRQEDLHNADNLPRRRDLENTQTVENREHLKDLLPDEMSSKDDFPRTIGQGISTIVFYALPFVGRWVTSLSVLESSKWQLSRYIQRSKQIRGMPKEFQIELNERNKKQ